MDANTHSTGVQYMGMIVAILIDASLLDVLSCV